MTFKKVVLPPPDPKREARKKAFMKGFSGVYRAETAPRANSGSIHHDLRMREASGSDTRKARNISGPAVKFGWTGRSGHTGKGESHPDEKKDYWLKD